MKQIIILTIYLFLFACNIQTEQKVNTTDKQSEFYTIYKKIIGECCKINKKRTIY